MAAELCTKVMSVPVMEGPVQFIPASGFMKYYSWRTRQGNTTNKYVWSTSIPRMDVECARLCFATTADQGEKRIQAAAAPFLPSPHSPPFSAFDVVSLHSRYSSVRAILSATCRAISSQWEPLNSKPKRTHKYPTVPEPSTSPAASSRQPQTAWPSPPAGT